MTIFSWINLSDCFRSIKLNKNIELEFRFIISLCLINLQVQKNREKYRKNLLPKFAVKPCLNVLIGEIMFKSHL